MKPNIKFSKDLEWLIPFVASVYHIIPLHKIKSIKSYKVQKGLSEQSYGSTIKGDKYSTINLRVYSYNDNAKKYRSETISIILDTLAHELSHVKQSNKDFGKHDYKHFRLQSLILFTFSGILEEMGIKDTSRGFNNL